METQELIEYCNEFNRSQSEREWHDELMQRERENLDEIKSFFEKQGISLF